MPDIKQIIKKFAEQLKFNSVIENKENLREFKKIVVVGMGGSHLAADLLKAADSSLDIIIHKDYGLPAIIDDGSLVIASSYSGNTEETIDAFKIALFKGLNLAIVSVGGELLKLAKENNIPYIQLPDVGLQPRMALGYSLKALLKLVGDEKELENLSKLTDFLDYENSKKEGEQLAQKIINKIPIIYSSANNEALALIWKIKINEGVKIPAFYNVFPEFNHNEMTSFDVIQSTKLLSDKFHFIFLKDKNDNPRIIKRMNLCQKLYEDKGFKVENLNLKGDFFFEKAFNSLLTADFCSYYLSKSYGTEPEKTPMIEEFKKMMRA